MMRAPRLKWHQLRRRRSDPVFLRANLEAALQTGAACEVDLVATADGHFLCLHDLTLDAETTGTGPVAALDRIEIERLRQRAPDGRPLADSKRILVIFATDARNSGMRFADSEAREILDFGHLPVLIQPGAVDFSLAGTGGWRIAPVGLDGVVKPVLQSGSGPIEFRLENGTPDGPTTYFVIERD